MPAIESPLRCFRGFVDEAGRTRIDERLVHKKGDFARTIAAGWTTDQGLAARMLPCDASSTWSASHAKSMLPIDSGGRCSTTSSRNSVDNEVRSDETLRARS